MTSERKYFSGKSLEIALMQAARHHGLQPEEVAYRKIEKRHGFLKSRKGVVIVVDPESPRISPDQAPAAADKALPEDEELAVEVMDKTDASGEPPLSATREEGPMSEGISEPEIDFQPEVESEIVTKVEAEESEFDRLPPAGDDASQAPESTEDLVDAARRGLEEILSFAKLDVVVEVNEGEGQLDIELSGPDRDRLVEDRGNLLLAIQHLLPRLIRGYTGRSIPCDVDSENFHARREVELEKLARDAAQEALDRQQSRTLPPMNPAERRIIHVTLADNKEVATESQGKGFFKRVTISPAMRRPRGFDRY